MAEGAVKWCWCVAAMLLWPPSHVHAQTRTGEIRLEVNDPSGAGVQASGKLESLAGGVDRNFRTDPQGAAALEGVAYGSYRLRVSAAGFATQSIAVRVESVTPVAQTVTLSLSTQAFNVDVVAVTPLSGVNLALQEIPSPVQVSTLRNIEDSGALNLSDLLNKRLNGVYLNEIQGNPYQADLNFRGYTASPLLGTPQGVSVYMDGVRLNQPFGDVVSWDLLPKIAILETALMPGSNPVFGLNTLGGALSIQTKDGQSTPGTSLELTGGSFGRKVAQLEHGGSTAKGLSWYLAGNLFFEDGWRESSPSDVRQFFGKLGWQRASTSLGLTVAYANNRLTGNGLQEQRLLARDYSSAYTKPDITLNRSPFLNLSLRHGFGPTVTISGNGYYRDIRSSTVNGDLNQGSLDQAVYQPSAADIRALNTAGYTGFPASGATAANTPFPFWRCIAQVLQRDEPGEKCDALLNRTHIQQHNSGVSGQLTWFATGRRNHNQLTAGLAYDQSTVDFLQSTQLGYLNPDRTVTGLNAFADGVTGGTINGEPFDSRVDLRGGIHTSSVYATDTLAVGRGWNFTLSGRYNRTIVDNRDRVRPEGAESLNGHTVFGRLNPAAGLTYSPRAALNFYFSFSEGSRAPASVELGCANPDRPCKLPNAMAGDPPLDQVIARTWEGGVRGGVEGKLHWTAGWFRAENRNDILFVASTQTGFGYFKNFGRTRRQGVEASLHGRTRRLSWGTGYTFLEATYESPETVNGSGNSANDAALQGSRGFDGVTAIVPGNQIPLIPQHMLKAYADIEATRKLNVDLGVLAISSSYSRGNENNLHQPDGTYYLGPGRTPGYAVVSLGARYRFHRRLEAFAQIDNLFNRRYETASQLGVTGITPQGSFLARPLPAVDGTFPLLRTTFLSPGAPLGAWGGIRVRF